jgi:FAD dependent oxidoreductase
MGPLLRLLKRCFVLLFVKVFLPMAKLYAPVNELSRRIRSSPGIPISNPSSSYWMEPPSPISEHNSNSDTPLPDYADVVIIGSGITGASFARTLLMHKDGKDSLGKPLKVIILEARGVCSGATGRCGRNPDSTHSSGSQACQNRHIGMEATLPLSSTRNI